MNQDVLPPGVVDLPEDEPEQIPEPFAAEPDGSDSAVDTRAHKKKSQRAKRKVTEEEQFWNGVLDLAIGRTIIWDLLEKCETFKYPSGVTPAGFPDPNAMMFHLGKQAIGRALYDMLAALNRDLVLQMHDEHDPTYLTIAKNRGYR